MAVIQEFNGGVRIDGETVMWGLTQNAIDALTAEAGTIAYAVSQNGHLWKIGGDTRTDITESNQQAKKDILGLQSDWAGLIDKTYPVGALYISVATTSPASMFGGDWEQITTDAYLKIVASGAGTPGGTSAAHTIPIESMPEHNHDINTTENPGSTMAECLETRPTWNNKGTVSTQSISYVGGGQPYYPYYIGVYVWLRTA